MAPSQPAEGHIQGCAGRVARDARRHLNPPILWEPDPGPIPRKSTPAGVQVPIITRFPYPLLGNLYLHYTLDVWFVREVKPRLRGEAVLVRYCDDFVIGFERREDAQRVAEVLGKRMERFRLTLHPEKTRLIAFERPKARERGGKGPGTFDFLGFTMYWRRTRHGRWEMSCKTRG